MLARAVFSLGLLLLFSAQPARSQTANLGTSAEQTPPPAQLGPFVARSLNFADRYGAHLPFEFHILDSTAVGNNDHFGGVAIDRTILSGSENYLVPPGHRLDCGPQSCNYGENAMALRLSLQTHSPVQIGGMVDALTRSYAPGDSISMTFENRYTGVSRGTDEGAHLFRTEVTPALHRWGGVLLSVDTQPATRADPYGNVPVNVKGCPGCELNASAEGGAPVINLSRAMPLGNVTEVEVYAPDPRFVVLSVDGAGRSLPASHWTSLTEPVDSRLHGDQCGSGTAEQKVEWTPGDPFRADPAGKGNRSALHCFAVGSTAGLTAGTVVAIGGEGSNLETTRVIEVVDGTHFVANAHFPHPGPSPQGATPHVAGDAVTWGGLAGYAAGFVADVVAPRDMSDAERKERGWQPAHCDWDGCNSTPLYLTPFVMASLSGNRLVVYINSEAAGTTLNTFGLMSNQPRRPARMSARVSGGHVVGLDTLATGDYRPLRNSDVRLSVNSGQTLLPPPVVTLPGCRVPPAIHTSLVQAMVTDQQNGTAAEKFGYGLTVEAHVDPQHLGEGCPDGAAVPLQVESHYANPLVAYPAALVYRAIRPGEQREDLNSAKGYQLWMPPSGTFAVGDNVIASTWPLQFVGDIQAYRRYLGFNSARFGPIHRWIFSGQSNNQSMIDVLNETTPYRFYSDAAHGFAPTADGGGVTGAPAGMSFTGAYANIFKVEGPPRRDVSGAPGSFVEFGCYHGSSVETLCEHNVLNAFNLFTVLPMLGGAGNHSAQIFTLDPEHHRWKFALNAPDGVIESDAAIEAPALHVGQGGCKGCTLAGETGMIGGGTLSPGQCATGSTHLEGAQVGWPVVVSASDGSLPGGAAKLDAAVTARGEVSVEVCAVTETNLPRRRYQVRVLP